MNRPRSPSDDGLSRRLVRRVQPSTLNDLKGLVVRLEPVEEAMAENQSLRADLERVVAEIEDGVAGYERSRRAPSHAPPEVTGR